MMYSIYNACLSIYLISYASAEIAPEVNVLS